MVLGMIATQEIGYETTNRAESPRHNLGKSIELNSFYGNLPGGAHRSLFDTNERIAGEDFSARARSKTYGGFFQEIDEVIGELGLDESEIIALQKGRGKDPQERARLHTIGLQIYTELIDRGYNHYPDLTA